MRNESQTYATLTERIHSFRQRLVHAGGLLHFSSENGNLTYSVTASWMISGLVSEIAEGHRLGHFAEVNFQDAIGQGGLFGQCPWIGSVNG